MRWVASPAWSAVRFVSVILDELALLYGERHALRAAVNTPGNVGEGARLETSLTARHELTAVAYA